MITACCPISRSKRESFNKNVKFCDLNDEDKQKMAEEVKKTVLKYWGGAQDIPAKLRRLIRENQSLVPEAATRSRGLALECLTTQNFNVFCPYHHTIDKAGTKTDGKDGQKYVLNGVPLPRETVHPDAIKALKTKKSALYTSKGEFRSPRLRDGYLNCGCEIDEALMDFYFWKTWTLTGVVNGEKVTESMRDQRFPPRLRAFLVKHFQDWTCLTIDDLYTGSYYRTPEHHQGAMYFKQLERILAKYNDLQEKLGGPKLSLEEAEGEFKVPGPDDEF
ncbi:hypothetical protein F5887DRAFT_922790 [Amanita rubescens]|nr:hypothetical protein F5887DRAFT_922790 [Amanita rubescens]